MTGAKYWVAFYKDPSLSADFDGGDMASIKFKSYCYWEKHILNNSFRAEAVVLRPRMAM